MVPPRNKNRPAAILQYSDSGVSVLDEFLLSLSRDGDDRALEFKRHLGSLNSNVVCFLPWKTPMALAKRFGLVPSEYLACYELPNAIVSSEPALCAVSMHNLIEDAVKLIRDRGLDSDAVVIGMSMGSAPATVVANRVGGTLRSIASADYGHLMLWESPATQEIRRRAESNGYGLADYEQALAGLNVLENYHNLSSTSTFVFGRKDKFVPQERRWSLEKALRRFAPQFELRFLDRGHILTMAEAMRGFEAVAGGGPRLTAAMSS